MIVLLKNSMTQLNGSYTEMTLPIKHYARYSQVHIRYAAHQIIEPFQSELLFPYSNSFQKSGRPMPVGISSMVFYSTLK